MWINWEISGIIGQNQDLLQVFRGPRQCGKSSLILHLDSEFEEISLDDPAFRHLAQSNPELLLKQFESKKLFIDEAQYAPQLFPLLKRRVDLAKRNSHQPFATIIRLTGSNQILLDRNVKESLAGRASFFEMNTLSVSEIIAARPTPIQEIIYTGGWPELHAHPGKDVKKYLDDYINSYIEKDIVLAAGIQKQNEFLKFVKLLAGRVGQIVDYSSLGNDADVDAKTVKDWLSVLERMRIIALVPPFYSNLSKRLIKSPKIYFIDSGLACRLQGWISSVPIMTSPQQGSLFENLVFSELYKTRMNYQLDWEIFHWRSRDGEELDFVVQTGPGRCVIVESKLGFRLAPDLTVYPEVRKVFGRGLPPAFNCHMEGERVLAQNIPIASLRDFALKNWVA
jgi:predicted AAA+ superfamily ATPase